MTDELPIARAYRKEIQELAEENARLKSSGGGGTSDGMESRVTRLEVQMEHLREDMGEVKADLKSALAILTELPTKSDLWAWKWQWTGLCVAAIAIIVGGIIGGLSWIKPDPTPATPPPPVVIQMPK